MKSVGLSNPKCRTPEMGEDIVQSIWRHIAVLGFIWYYQVSYFAKETKHDNYNRTYGEISRKMACNT